MAASGGRSLVETATRSPSFRKLLLGRSWASKVPNAARIFVRTMEFDKNLKMVILSLSPRSLAYLSINCKLKKPKKPVFFLV